MIWKHGKGWFRFDMKMICGEKVRMKRGRRYFIGMVVPVSIILALLVTLPLYVRPKVILTRDPY
jgi:hypothetical protein